MNENIPTYEKMYGAVSTQSGKKVSKICDLQTSKNCEKKVIREYRHIFNNKQRNNGKYICFQCFKHEYSSGHNAPNSKYNYDNNLFKKINCEEKAYILGLIASDGHIDKSLSRISIALHKQDEEILRRVRDYICKEIPIGICKNKMRVFKIHSREMAKDIARWLKIHGGKKSHTVQFPDIDESLMRHFIRGYFDGDGSIPRNLNKYPTCSIGSNSSDILSVLETKYMAKKAGNTSVYWSGNKCLDFLGLLYDNSSISMARKRNRYYDICCWVPGLGGSGNNGSLPELKWVKSKEDAVPPKKHLPSDSGYDLTIIDIVKDMGDTKLYGTGIKVDMGFGWYGMIAPRSSISKTGYILSNSVGIIDRSYNGEILVALTKIDDSKPDIELPCRIAQLIPMPVCHFQFIEVDSLDETFRGDGGFGSSGS